MNKKFFFQAIAPLLLIVLIAPFTPKLDLLVTHAFYEKGSFSSHPIFLFLYKYGPLPAIFTTWIAFFLFIGSFFIQKTKNLRKDALYLVLVMAIGSGLLINVILKDHWGRPRPKQIEQFGGSQSYRPFWSPNFFHQPTPSKSFPSGHAATGFFFFAFYFVGKRKKNAWLTYGGLALGFILGIVLSLTRIAQGGHFLSDVMISALLMWWTALILAQIIYKE